ncbi:MAG TPA: hypothetical protein VIK78_00320 [Ruminiclostridium sp.]
MNKEDIKKATFKDLIAKKLKKEQDQFKTKDIYVSSMDATLTFKKPSDDVMLDIMEEIGDGTDTRKTISAFRKLIYLCCDTLQDPELHTQIEVADPLDTIEKLFDLVDTEEIGEQLVNFIKFGDKIKEIKN